MTGEQAFEVAAAVAAISGLAALLVMSLIAVAGVWRLFREASEASVATMRLAVSLEEVARRLSGQQPQAGSKAEEDQFAPLRRQAETLLEQQGRLHEMARDLLDTDALEVTPNSAAVEDLQATVNRLDVTVGQMATSLANVIQQLERR